MKKISIIMIVFIAALSSCIPQGSTTPQSTQPVTSPLVRSQIPTVQPPQQASTPAGGQSQSSSGSGSGSNPQSSGSGASAGSSNTPTSDTPTPAVSPSPRYPLDGLWKSSESYVIQIADLTTAIDGLWNDNSDGDCPINNDHRVEYFFAKLSGSQLSGKMDRCTHTADLVLKCNLTSKWQVDINGSVSADNNTITLNYMSQWYDYTPNSKSACKYTRNSAGDALQTVTLTRLSATPTPTPFQAGNSGVCTSADPEPSDADKKVIDFMKDKAQEAIDKLKETAREIEGTGSTAAQQIDDINVKITQLEKYIGYLNQIKAASCVPSEILQDLRQLANYRQNGQDTTATLTDLCARSADWIISMTGDSASREEIFALCVSEGY